MKVEPAVLDGRRGPPFLVLFGAWWVAIGMLAVGLRLMAPPFGTVLVVSGVIIQFVAMPLCLWYLVHTIRSNPSHLGFRVR